MGARNDDLSLILTKAKKEGFLPDVKDSEVAILEAEAAALFGDDGPLGNLFAPKGVAAGLVGKILCIGTSITFGVGASSDALKYANRVAAHLPAMMQGMAVTVIANGVSGSTSTEMLARIKAQLDLHKPTFVFIETSINDTRTDRTETPAQTEANVRAMVAMTRAYGATPIVGTSAKLNSAVFGGVYNAGSEAEAIQANDLVKAAMASLGVQVVDLYSMYTAPSYLSDGLHPNNTGHDHWGQNVAAGIAARPLIVFPLEGTYRALDIFTRANSTTTLGTTETGGYTYTYEYTTNPGVWGINTNQAYPVSVAGETYALIDDGLANFTQEVRVAVKTNGSAGTLFRYVDPANFWLVYVNGAGNWQLMKRNLGTYAPGAIGPIAVNNDLITIVANGSSIIVKINNVTQITTTDAYQSTATKKGLWAGNGSSAVRYDDFSTQA